MRGRTNVGDGVALNANTVNKTVKSGQITAGDFVGYYTERSYIDQSNRLNFLFAVGDYLIAQAKDGTSLTAFKNGEQIATYSGRCDAVGKYNNWIVFHNNLLGVLGVLSISDNGFTLIDSVSTSDTLSGATGIAGGNGKICYAKRYTNSGYSYLKVGIVNIANNGTLSGLNITDIVGQSNDVFDVEYYNAFYVIRTSSSVKLSIDSNNEVTIDSTINFEYSIYANNGSRIVYRSGQVIGIAFHDGSSSSSSTDNTGHLQIANFVTGGMIYKTIANYGEVLTIINDGFLITSERVKSGSYYYTYKFNLCSFSDDTCEITKLDTITLAENTYAIEKMISVSLGGIKDDIAYLKLHDSANDPIELYEVVDDSYLQSPSQHNYVVPYGTGGHPIGVAKTNGNVNDVIPVYIPTPSV